MNGIKRLGMAATLGAILVSGSAIGWAQQEPGPIERAGEKLDEAGRSLRQGLERGLSRTKEAVRESFEKTRDRVNDMNIEARVYGRLRWDKSLETSTFALTVEAQGIVTLRGSVPTEEAREHAVDLAAQTVGVTRVIDQLAVQTDVQTIEATPGSDSAPRRAPVRSRPARPTPPPAATDE